MNIDKIKIELKVAIRCTNEEHTKKILEGVLEELEKTQCITMQGIVLSDVKADTKAINDKGKKACGII